MDYFDVKKMTREQLIEKMKKLSQSYTPEWDFSAKNSDVGSALALIYADLFTEVIKKMNQMPEKHYVDFLNLLNPVQNPSKGARGYVTFSLSEGTENTVPVSEGKQLIGASDDVENLIFETIDDLLLVPSELENLYIVNSEKDEISHQYNSSREVIKPFFLMPSICEHNLQSHEIIFSHKQLLNLKTSKGVEIYIEDNQNKIRKLETLKLLTDKDVANWYYKVEEQWTAFEFCVASEESILLRNKNVLSLETPEIMLKLKTAKKIVCNTIDIKPLSTVQPPDALYHNEIELPVKDFLMFGNGFYAYDAFYISSEEIFSKKGSTITIDLEYLIEQYKTPFDMPPPNIRWKNVLRKSDLKEPEEKQLFISDMMIEYWNGLGWSMLDTKQFNRKMFENDSSEPQTEQICFECPEDIEKTIVGAYNNYWIRIRLLKVENAYVSLGYYLAPKLKRVRLNYVYSDHGLKPESILRHEFLVESYLNLKQKPLVLFNDYGALDCNALYLNFNEALVGAPIKILFEIKTQLSNRRAHFKWQMLLKTAGKLKWHDLDVIDETNNFQETGLVTLIGNNQHANTSIFGQDGFWLRVVQMEKGTLPILIHSIHMNSISVVQKETILSQFFDLKRHEYHKTIELNHQNLETLEVWINEKDIDPNALKLEHIIYKIIYTPDGVIDALWVKWNAYKDFALMKSDTRGYIANLYEGQITFGDSVHGYLPHGNFELNVRVDYSINQGEFGNVEAFTIKRLAQSIPNVNTVYNPIECHGGHAPESRVRALTRTSESIHHRGRARSSRDFDALILSADFDIKESLTLSNTNAGGFHQPGMVTSIILPKKALYEQDYFRALKEKITAHISEHLPCTLRVNKNYFIIEPRFVTVDVQFKGTITHLNQYLKTYNAIESIISNYLNTYKGNKDGEGWHIGALPDEQFLLSSLQMIESIKDVDHLVLNAIVEEGYNNKEVSFEELRKMPQIIIRNGSHHITLTT